MRRSVFTAVASLICAGAVLAQQHTVVIDMNDHVTKVMSDAEQAQYAPSFNLTPAEFRGQYVMRSQWYNAPPKPKGGAGPELPPVLWPIFGNPPKGSGQTPDKQRPVIPASATGKKDNEIVVPLRMHFETQWKAKDQRPAKGCPHPNVRLQWKTDDNSGWYMPYWSPTTGTTAGGTGFPPHGELRVFTADYSDAYAVVANMGDVNFQVRLWALCGSQMWEKVDDKDVKLGN